MKYVVTAVLATLALIPAAAQEQARDGSLCRSYFQVLRAKAGNPGLQVGLDSGQRRWWENAGSKKYPGLCLEGSVTSTDKPRFVIVLSNSKSIGPSSGASNEVYGQKLSDFRRSAPKEWIYQSRWNVASVTILTISYDGGLELPPVYLAPGKLKARVLWPDSSKVLEAAVKYLAQEPVLSVATREITTRATKHGGTLSGESAPEEPVK